MGPPSLRVATSKIIQSRLIIVPLVVKIKKIIPRHPTPPNPITQPHPSFSTPNSLTVTLFLLKSLSLTVTEFS